MPSTNPRECQCTDEVHRGHACAGTAGLPHSSNRCRWCRDGHPGATG